MFVIVFLCDNYMYMYQQFCSELPMKCFPFHLFYL